ncbi:Pyruvate decarboxylase [Planoprotostelium fungivorum]|uniref:Pyruvate decarboxylase n=1 Tax=Planoprotostelium fungivorum TaxID=1890364 RepID=A0A2P6MMQ7_9EUKA|nr:Pyruvate decarboxylase [Planoprotostelium fungivorum]
MSHQPQNSTENNSEEIAVLQHVGVFRSGFTQHYSQRPTLLLTPKNEHGLEKLVCTTIKPTKLPYKELYTVNGCAKFVTDYFKYVPLEEPHSLPEVMPSPNYTFREQQGNSFDLSIVLASLLIGMKSSIFINVTDIFAGAGFDAYCTKVEPEVSTTYDKLLVKRPVLESSFLTKKKDTPERVPSRTVTPVSSKTGDLTDTRPGSAVLGVSTTEFLGKRVHCWVLVLPHKTDNEGPIFIEPSTGEKFNANEECGYLGIESVWNHQNYWVNMQEYNVDQQQGTSFILQDMAKWEFASHALEVPTSWTNRIELSREQFYSRYPGSQKKILYHRYGMIRQINVYSDDERTILIEQQEFFLNRKDALEFRKRKFNEGKTIEQFERGRSYDLREIVTIENQRKEMHFWRGTHVEGLISRIVIFGRKVVETYGDRDDHLIYRSATLDPTLKDDTLTKISDGRKLEAVRKMTQKYAQNPTTPADKDLCKITFHLDAKKTEVKLNDGVGLKTGRIYTKEGKTRGFQADLFLGTKPGHQELTEDYQKYTAMEKECAAKLKDTDREFANITLDRRREEEHVELKYSVYDVRRNPQRQARHQNSAQVEESLPEKQDYLSIFIASVLENGRKQMNKDTARIIVDAALKSFKDRLSQKEKLLNARLEKESKAMRKRVTLMNKSQDMETEEELEHQRFIAETTFRKRILEQRMKRVSSGITFVQLVLKEEQHYDTLPSKIEEFTKKIRSDARKELSNCFGGKFSAGGVTCSGESENSVVVKFVENIRTKRTQRGQKQARMSKTNLSQYLFSRLKEIGCDHVFGVPGDFILSLFVELNKSPVKYVGTCNELNAAYAADAYARIKGIGAVATTYGVGELSAINGVAGSYAERLPIVVITGAPGTTKESSGLPLHHTLGDYAVPRDIYSKVTVGHFHLNQNNKHVAAEEIDRLLVTCLKESRPVYLSIPQDLVDMEMSAPKDSIKSMIKIELDNEAFDEALNEAVEAINKAKQPIFVADVGLKRMGLKKQFEGLLKASGIPFAALMMGKCLVDEEHEQFIGLYMGDNSREYVRERVNSSDLVVFFGMVKTDFNTGTFTINIPNKRSIDIHDNSVRIQNHTYDKIHMSNFIEGLTQKVNKRDPSSMNIKKASEGCSHRKTQDYEPQKGAPLKVNRLFQRFSKYIPDNSIVVAETGVSLFAAAETMMPRNCDFIAQIFYGSIGYTIGATLGAAVAAPEKKTFLFVGDGSLQVTVQDISTMIRYGTKPTIVVLNNDGYTIERLIIDGSFNDIQMWKYAMLPEVFGGRRGETAKTEDELEQVLTKIGLKEFNLIEVFTDKMDATQSLVSAGKGMARLG